MNDTPTPMRLPLVAAALVALVVTIGTGPRAIAQNLASPWVDGHGARVRLVDGGTAAPADRLIGVEIAAELGWHTYWRNPGDSGVPPTFDWTGSTNLAGAEVLWPAPVAIDIGYGISIGYKDGVVLPVRVRPETADVPVDIALELDYAVCREVCVPLHASLALTLSPDIAMSRPSPVAAALARVPVRQSDAADGPRILASRTELRDDKVVLIVTASAAATPPPALFVEGPADYYFSVPDAPVSAEGIHEFVVEVDGAKSPQALSGRRIGATLVAADGAVEHWWTVE